MKGTLTTLILGAALAEFGLTGLQHEDGSSYQPAEQASAVYEQIVPISAYGPPPGMVMTSNAGIEQDVEAGVRQLDSGVRKLPGYAMKVAESVEQHGIAALAYEDPEMKRVGREIGARDARQRGVVGRRGHRAGWGQGRNQGGKVSSLTENARRARGGAALTRGGGGWPGARRARRAPSG